MFHLNHFFIENLPVHNSLGWVDDFSKIFCFIRYNSMLLQIISLGKLSPEAVKYKKKKQELYLKCKTFSVNPQVLCKLLAID